MTTTRSALALIAVSLFGCGGDTDAGTDAGVTVDLAIAADSATLNPDLDTPPDLAKPLDPRDGPGVFSAVGNHVRHIRSLDDGLTWVDDKTEYDQSMMGDLYGIRNVVFGNGQFVAFAAKVLTSPDAKTWTEVTKPSGQWLAAMLYAQGEWVSSGGYGWLATTVSDLGNWTQHSPVDNYTTAHHSRSALAHGVIGTTHAYVVVDDNGAMFYSADATTWTATTGVTAPAAGNTWGTQLVFGGGTFIGLLPNGTDTIRSTDGGATWTMNTALASSVQSMLYAQGRFTAIGNGHVFISTDGATWNDHAETSAHAGDLTYGHGVYLALDGGGNIYRSTDGLTWSQVFANMTNPDSVAAIAFGPS